MTDNSEMIEQFRRDKEDLVFVARLSSKYHQDLAAFYGRFVQWTVASSLLFSSAAFVAFGNWFPGAAASQQTLVGTVAATIVTVLNAVVLGFGFPAKLDSHGAFRRKWIELEMEVTLLSDRVDDASIEAFEATRRRSYLLHAEEPPIDKARALRAQRFAATSLGRDHTYDAIVVSETSP